MCSKPHVIPGVPWVLLRASRRNMRCGGCGVNMPNFSEAPASIALMWICDAPAHDQTKIRSLYKKEKEKVYYKLPTPPAWGSYS